MQLTKSSTTTSSWRRPLAAVAAFAVAMVGVLSIGGSAGAAIVPTVPLATAADYSVLAGSAVTNTGPSVLAASLGVSPGSAVSGFPPGIVVAPGTIQATTAAAATAQDDLTLAYDNAFGREIDATTPADLVNQTLLGGVYAAAGKGALELSGPLVLDGAGDPSSVFIFQTNSSLTTASSSTVTLINGAQACNVFWQVGSSATLGTSSTFVGNILALTSITLTTGANVEGRALAREGAVTLDTNTFTAPSCQTTPVSTTSASTASTASTVPGSGPSGPGTPDGVDNPDGSGSPTPDDSSFDLTSDEGQDTGELASTGVPLGVLVAAAMVMILAGIGGIWLARTAP